MKVAESVCPVCLRKVNARLVEEAGGIFMEKSCVEHGFFRTLYWGDANSYGRFIKREYDGVKTALPETRLVEGCPFDCGLCGKHESQTVLAVIDVTERCNLKCPVCFADAGKGADLSFQEIEGILRGLRAVKPVPVVAVQFSGGEPTLRDDLPEIVYLAKRKLGFIHPEVNTNGIRIASDIEYLKRLVDAGVKVIYLSFDGIDDRVYEKLRGRPLLDVKENAVENCRKLGFSKVVLSVTLAAGINDSQVGAIIDYAVRNSDVVRGVNFQPVSFSGRNVLNSSENRITTPEFMKLAEEQTNGRIKACEFRPVSSTVPLLKFIEHYTGVPRIIFSAHPCCGVGTYLFLDKKGYKTLDNIINLDSLERLLEKAVAEVEEKKPKGLLKELWKIKYGLQILLKTAPSIRNKETRDLVLKVLTQRSSKPIVHYAHKNTLLIGCMHFMDAENFDLERVRKCIIHYATKDGRRIPFCSYNTIHRTKDGQSKQQPSKAD
ncbi:MAG: radical SAM protein [Candidatus Altiarchaeota archaeon]|nr:radical SAM protein [Candidatus Altiarchaeota archaeon]